MDYLGFADDSFIEDILIWGSGRGLHRRANELLTHITCYHVVDSEK